MINMHQCTILVPNTPILSLAPLDKPLGRTNGGGSSVIIVNGMS